MSGFLLRLLHGCAVWLWFSVRFSCLRCPRSVCHRFRHLCPLDQLRFQQSAVHAFKDRIVHILLSLEAQLHLCGVYIDIDGLPVHVEMQDCKREFVLHGKVFIRIFQ